MHFGFDDARDRAAQCGLHLPAFKEFWAPGGTRVEFDRDSSSSPTSARPRRHPLRTPSGKIETFSETVAGFGYADCPGHPAWLPPHEWLGSPRAERYPLHLYANQPRTRLHGQLDMGRVSQAAKVGGPGAVPDEPADAAARDIADGDLILIRNDRGSCLAGAVLTAAIRPGVAQMATGAWFDPVEGGTPGSMDKHGNPNVLTQDIGTSRLGQGPSAQSLLVQISRVDDNEIPPVTAFDPPPMSARSGPHRHIDLVTPQNSHLTQPRGASMTEASAGITDIEGEERIQPIHVATQYVSRYQSVNQIRDLPEFCIDEPDLGGRNSGPTALELDSRGTELVLGHDHVRAPRRVQVRVLRPPVQHNGWIDVRRIRMKRSREIHVQVGSH